MKKFLFLSILAISVALGSTAQSRFINRNGDERFGTSLKTTDSTLKYLDSVVTATNEGGIITVSVIGYSYDSTYSVTGVKSVRFNKRNGTLTMGTVVDEVPNVTDAGLGTATWDLVAANGKIYVRIKGRLNYNIIWTAIIKRKTVTPR